MFLVAGLLCVQSSAQGQEAEIRKNLSSRMPELKSLDEVRKTEYPGVYEVRANKTDLYYTDAKGSYLLRGNLIDTKTRKNLTQERMAVITAVKFDALPFKDAFTIVRGNGQRKVAVFEDPNCGFCKRFERDLQKITDVTIYVFLYPILGADSTRKSKTIWCSKDPAGMWQDLMLRDQAIPGTLAMCDSTALDRNLELGRIHRIEGTPHMVFSNNAQLAGAVDIARIEKHLADASAN